MLYLFYFLLVLYLLNFVYKAIEGLITRDGVWFIIGSFSVLGAFYHKGFFVGAIVILLYLLNSMGQENLREEERQKRVREDARHQLAVQEEVARLQFITQEK